MLDKGAPDRDAARRRAILDAALRCFLQFGFSKTSIDDIAKRAHLSRPLIYRKFKNKEEIFGAVYEDLFEARYPRADEIVAGRGSKRDKVTRLLELFVLEPWAIMLAAPMAQEFYEACERILPEQEAKMQRQLLRYAHDLIGDRDVAEVMMLSVDGLMGDLPSTAVLRKRLLVLVDRFVR
jgi:TetR/AcrR family transcriptional regulator, transcriptional repressor of aconitase